MVASVIFAEGRILLIRRGQEPYKNKWAWPGGFVEAGESLETAAVREVQEEVGLLLNPVDIYPFGVLSLPHINQVCGLFFTKLKNMQLPLPQLPEVLDADWFEEHEIPWNDLWDPAKMFDISLMYEQARTGRFDFYQQTDTYMRLFCADTQERFIWRNERFKAYYYNLGHD